jgi:DNA-binding NtrC family response regulator
MLRYQKYHLIMLDVRMPRKDGLEVLKFVNREFPDIPVIIVTGLASLQEIKDTVKMGAFACLKKPFVLEKVLKTVNKALVLKCKHGQVVG